jgi:hypothetical protein
MHSSRALPSNVRFWADFHRAGRYLLERPDLPLSAWPHMLDLLNEFLKGPAFLGREGFVLRDHQRKISTKQEKGSQTK